MINFVGICGGAIIAGEEKDTTPEVMVGGKYYKTNWSKYIVQSRRIQNNYDCYHGGSIGYNQVAKSIIDEQDKICDGYPLTKTITQFHNKLRYLKVAPKKIFNIPNITPYDVKRLLSEIQNNEISEESLNPFLEFARSNDIDITRLHSIKTVQDTTQSTNYSEIEEKYMPQLEQLETYHTELAAVLAEISKKICPCEDD